MLSKTKIKNPLNYGLTDNQIEIIKNILSSYNNVIEHVEIFGSRALGNYRNNSDIDLVLFGNIDEKIVGRLWTLFSESPLAIKVDIVAYNSIKTAALKKHIDQVGVVLFT